MAKEWWAKAGTAQIAAAIAATPKVLTFIAGTPPLFLNIGRACSADRATVRKRRSDELTAARAVSQRVNVDSDTVARLETVRLPTALDLPRGWAHLQAPLHGLAGLVDDHDAQ